MIVEYIANTKKKNWSKRTSNCCAVVSGSTLLSVRHRSGESGTYQCVDDRWTDSCVFKLSSKRN